MTFKLGTFCMLNTSSSLANLEVANLLSESVILYTLNGGISIIWLLSFGPFGPPEFDKWYSSTMPKTVTSCSGTQSV